MRKIVTITLEIIIQTSLFIVLHIPNFILTISYINTGQHLSTVLYLLKRIIIGKLP